MRAGNAPFQITIHDGKEDLEEEVDCIKQDRQQEEPRFARHFAGEELPARLGKFEKVGKG